MKLMRIMPVLCIAAVVSVCDAAADESDGQSYLIHIDRPEKIGNRHHIEFRSTLKADTVEMADGRTYRETSETGLVDLVGTLTVVALASNGGPSSVDILIDRCEMTTNGTASAIAGKGDRLAVMGQVGVPYGSVRLNDVTLDKTTAILITYALPVSEPDRTERAGPLYGLDTRRQVGERWDINAASLAKFMRRYKPGAKESDFTGTAEFMAITRTNGAEWANVRLNMTCGTPPPDRGPWKITGFRAKTEMSLSLPLGDKPLKTSGEAGQTQKIWMGNDYENHGVLQHLIYNAVSKYRVSFTIVPLDPAKPSSGD